MTAEVVQFPIKRGGVYRATRILYHSYLMGQVDSERALISLSWLKAQADSHHSENYVDVAITLVEGKK